MENKERTSIIDLHKLRTCEMVRIYAECKKDCKTCDFYVKPERKKEILEEAIDAMDKYHKLKKAIKEIIE